ncbi:MFS transporter [Aestuariirhabdus haliotis]|uniref:MFS transporter n=1 Tax=Aestuariirhabdus haliotis TaxID=2918751 RepID=UPI0020BF65E4|nr:MFS transporter [Aestuariirhabdus haliotis]MCL6421098.1 MFS transporter [Aestuariirhabdus haliotis]
MIEIRTPLFWHTTLALSLGSFMVFANIYTTQPMLPLLSEQFGVSPLMASWSLSLTTLMLACSLLIYGPLSDAIGRRGLMLGSLAGVLLVTLALGFVDDFYSLLLLRMLQGLLLGGFPAIAIAYMGDEYSKPAMGIAVGIYISGNTLGGIGGRLIGGFMTDLAGWQSSFLLMSVISLICLLVLIALLPKSQHFTRKPFRFCNLLADMGAHIGNPMLLLAYLIGGFNFFIFINQYSYATFLLSAPPYNLSASFLGMLFLCYLSGTLASALSGQATRCFSLPLCMLLGIGVFMAGTLLTLLTSLSMVLIGLLVNSVGFFFCHSVASAWVSHNAGFSRGTASSLYLVFYYVGASVGGFYLDPFWHQWGWAGIVLGSLLILLFTAGCAVALWGRERKSRVSAETASRRCYPGQL